MRLRTIVGLVAVTLTLSACRGDFSALLDSGIELPPPDAGGIPPPDAGVPDAGAPDAGAPVPIVIAAVGDIAGAGMAMDQSAAVIDRIQPDAVLTLGDNVYPAGAASDYAAYFEPSIGRFKAITRPGPGNHDHVNFVSGYCTYFGDAAHCHPDGYGYYSYDLGDWHLIALDSGCSSPSSCADPMLAGTAMMEWLAQDLKANNRKCTLAYWHHPRFSSDKYHGSDTQVAPLWNALAGAGVDVILNGHSHTFERFAPQTPAGAADAATGIASWVVGTGGAGMYGFSEPLPNSEFRDGVDHGVLKLTLHATSYDWEFDTYSSGVKDKGSGECH